MDPFYWCPGLWEHRKYCDLVVSESSTPVTLEPGALGLSDCGFSILTCCTSHGCQRFICGSGYDRWSAFYIRS